MKIVKKFLDIVVITEGVIIELIVLPFVLLWIVIYAFRVLWQREAPIA